MRSEVKLFGDPDAYQGLYLVLTEEWSQFLEPCNWRTFHIAHLQIEDDRILGGGEVTLVLFGFGIQLRWNYVETDTVDEIKAAIKRVSPTQTEEK